MSKRKRKAERRYHAAARAWELARARFERNPSPKNRKAFCKAFDLKEDRRYTVHRLEGLA